MTVGYRVELFHAHNPCVTGHQDAAAARRLAAKDYVQSKANRGLAQTDRGLAATDRSTDRDTFTLNTEQSAAWDSLNSGPARELKSVRALLKRPSPFAE